MRKTIIGAGAVVLAVMAFSHVPLSAQAQSDIKTERVQFAKGTTSTTIKRTIKGRQTIDFLVGARPGQTLTVKMTSRSRAVYFNLIAPGERDVAFYSGEMSSPFNSYDGIVQKNGDIKVRVYLNRAAARRGESAAINLSITVKNAPGYATQLPDRIPVNDGRPTQLPGDVMVPGTNYNATGSVQCWTASGRAGTCPFGVRRQGGGNGSVTITKADGRTRTVFFERGNPTGYDFSQADPAPFSWRRNGDEVSVMIGQERYVIPDAAIYGG